MKRPKTLLIVAVWLVCGFISWGWSNNANSQRPESSRYSEFPVRYDRSVIKITLCAFNFALGPFALISTAIMYHKTVEIGFRPW
jgi:hypothetical protein